ncbi:TonB-dependent receptor [Hyphomonas sp.]|uniref:TonB-dependent receptor n=1 Tax=Hyphomonas sp. TaxID=87 RepID=UPI0030F531F4
MPNQTQKNSVRRGAGGYWRAGLLAGVALPLGTMALAQEEPVSVPAASVEEEARQDVVVVTGIRASLATALNEKRAADNLVEVIRAEDIGKLPDQNLAEVLENIPGVQITREAGVGKGVQIRGTNSNRTEINGVSTVGSGSGRGGISFEDVSAAMIAAVEVTKASEAKTIEGSVGGTINLRTIRPLDLDDRLLSVRIQGEDSSLTTDGIKPRLSGAYGDKWTTSAGELGVVASLSYAEQDATAFRPRVDRDNFVAANGGSANAQSFDFLPIQFLIQDYDNYESKTTNFSGSLEFRPNGLENMKFYFDAIVNDQERREQSSRVQASGVSDLAGTSVPDEFETVNFGSINGQNLGSVQAAVRGIIPVQSDGSDGNLRLSGDTNSRLTDSQIFRLGTDWTHGDKLSGRVEFATANSDTRTPSINTTLNFLNPNAPTSPTYTANDNGTPFAYDLTGGRLTWGIAYDAAFAPTAADLLDPANYALQQVQLSESKAENSEDAFRADFTYEENENFSFDFGYRFNKTTSLNDDITSNVSLSLLQDSPTGDLFADLLAPGPNNFNAADGRALYVRDFLLMNPDIVASDPQRVLDTLNAAIAANNLITGSTRGPISEPTSAQAAFFDIEEKTHAWYGQANFSAGMFRGNAGLRYIQTDISSTGNTILGGVATPTTTEGSYDFVLPRFNLVADVRDDVVLRASWGKDIRRPDFDDLSTSYTFTTSPNPAVNLGNPGLEPQVTESFDLGAEWYFAPSAVLSVGIFQKKRTGLFVSQQENPVETPTVDANGVTQLVRDVTAPCEGGGIFNPISPRNVFAPLDPVTNLQTTSGVAGVCVPSAQLVNDPGETTQKGVEVAFQYDLSSFEDRLGWASGFGVVANYTHLSFSPGEGVWDATSRAATVFAANGATDVELPVTEIDLSEDSYNTTLYYEKYGLSARARYTWRSAYRSEDFGSTSSYPWGFPVVQEARGQLNASVNYSVNDHLSIGIEGVNLTESPVEQSCVNEGALLCFQGLTDRRIVFGASYNF